MKKNLNEQVKEIKRLQGFVKRINTLKENYQDYLDTNYSSEDSQADRDSLNDNDEVIALLDNSIDDIRDTIVDTDFINKIGLGSAELPPLLLRGEGGWMDLGSIYDDDAEYDDKYTKITTSDLNGPDNWDTIIRDVIKVFKASENPDDTEHIDYDYYNNILN